MPIVLTDDGTMDTVLRCTICDQEMRYNFDPAPISTGEQTEEERRADYREFVSWAIEDAYYSHECQPEEAA